MTFDATFDLSSCSSIEVYSHDCNHFASRAPPPPLPPPPHLPPAMTRFASLVAIAAVATVTSDALVPGADAARLGTWMMSSEFCPPRRACAAPLPPWHTALPVIERLGVVGRGVWAGWRAGGRECQIVVLRHYKLTSRGFAGI